VPDRSHRERQALDDARSGIQPIDADSPRADIEFSPRLTTVRFWPLRRAGWRDVVCPTDECAPNLASAVARGARASM